MLRVVFLVFMFWFVFVWCRRVRVKRSFFGNRFLLKFRFSSIFFIVCMFVVGGRGEKMKLGG